MSYGMAHTDTPTGTPADAAAHAPVDAPVDISTGAPADVPVAAPAGAPADTPPLALKERVKAKLIDWGHDIGAHLKDFFHMPGGPFYYQVVAQEKVKRNGKKKKLRLHHEFRKQKKAEAKLRGERYIQPKDPYGLYKPLNWQPATALSEKEKQFFAAQYALSYDDVDAITPA
ncbi:hypothetical protein V498_10237, partial [Pseudogymnoascus sp. VKM F-4517 (FW-2822)]